MSTNYQHYWEVLKKSLPKIILLSMAVSLLVYVVASKSGPSYEVHYSYVVSLGEREAVDGFRYDGYYALSATDLFAATLSAWIRTPEVIVRAHEEAGVETAGKDARDLVKLVTADKTGPQIVAVTVIHKDKEIAEKLAEGLRTVIADNIEEYHGSGIPEVRFNVMTTKPWTGETSLAVGTMSLATFVFSLLLAVNGVILVESFKQAESLE